MPPPGPSTLPLMHSIVDMQKPQPGVCVHAVQFETSALRARAHGGTGVTAI
jgi:hypothetical protein